MKGNIYKTQYGFQVRFGRKLCKHFKTLSDAERFLNYVRVQTDEGIFDIRDHRQNMPLSFSTLAERWLEMKQLKVKRKSFNNLSNYMTKAMRHFRDTNIKTINYGNLEDFLYHSDDIKNLSDKTRSNIKSCLHDFFKWISRREKIPCPDFPDTPFELGTRKITDIATQQDVINEVYRQTYHINPKIWIGIKWLATYPSVRPSELLNIQEKHINRRSGTIVFPHPKEKKPKMIFLDAEDKDLLNRFPITLNQELYFFRHVKGISGVKVDQKFADNYLYKNWRKACKVVGLEGVPLYPGTKHTTATGLSEYCTPEEVKDLTGHVSKAFERYFMNKQGRAKKVTAKLKDLQKNSYQHVINIKGS